MFKVLSNSRNIDDIEFAFYLVDDPATEIDLRSMTFEDAVQFMNEEMAETFLPINQKIMRETIKRLGLPRQTIMLKLNA